MNLFSATLDDTVELTDPDTAILKMQHETISHSPHPHLRKKHQSPLSTKKICTNFGGKETIR